MRFTPNRRTRPNSPEHEQERARRQDPEYLVGRLQELAPDSPDETLRREIYRWIVLAQRLPEDDKQFIQRELQSLNSRWPMYRERGKDNAECFPDSCLQDCKNAQHQHCPMLNDLDTLRRRDRIRERAETPAEYRDEMQALAADVDCHVVLEAIDTIDRVHGPIINYGRILLMQAQEDINWADQSEALAQELADTDLDELAEAADIDLPPPEEIESAEEISVDATVSDAGGDDGNAPGEAVDEPEVTST